MRDEREAPDWVVSLRNEVPPGYRAEAWHTSHSPGYSVSTAFSIFYSSFSPSFPPYLPPFLPSSLARSCNWDDIVFALVCDNYRPPS